MPDKIPVVQEALRELGYPISRRTLVKAFRLDPITNAPSFDDVQIWHFVDRAQTSWVTVANNNVGYFTTTYGTFEEIQPRIADAVQAVYGAVRMDVLERCGLRYLNVVHPTGAQTFNTYLRSEIVGLDGERFGVSTEKQISVYQAKTEFGTLFVKFSTDTAPAVVPPDLAALPVKIEPRIPQGDRIGTLDFDHFALFSEEFSVDTAMRHLGDLHDAIARAFNACVTPEGFETWGRRDA